MSKLTRLCLACKANAHEHCHGRTDLTRKPCECFCRTVSMPAAAPLSVEELDALEQLADELEREAKSRRKERRSKLRKKFRW